eukprot:comp10595_c0_seq1/m.5281 comp10595_c0_seq1/g.5281  ORF comp10595_c0_seq1/g.5281 comp10595_c0_seq1/m.5281 type:complete len:261 (-) comp10595_c0_seq1:471-1253(-)
MLLPRLARFVPSTVSGTAIKASTQVRGLLNLVNVERPVKQTTTLKFGDAIKVLRAYALPQNRARQETLEVSMVLNTWDKKKKNRQIIRGSALLPRPVGKKKKICVLAEGADVAAAQAAGAAMVGGAELLQQLVDGSVDRKGFDLIVASTAFADQIKKAAPTLRAMTPTAKNGTLTADVSAALQRFTSSLDFKSSKEGTLCGGLGKLTYSDEELFSNIAAFVKAVKAAKPKETRTGVYIEKMTLATTYGPGVRVVPDEYDK